MSPFEKLGELFGHAIKALAELFLTKCLFPFMDRIGSELLGVTPGFVNLLEEVPDLPDAFKDIIRMSKEGKGEATAILGSLFAGTAISGAMSASLFPAMEGIKQVLSSKQPFQAVPIINLIILMYRKLIEPEFFYKEMKRYGINEAVAYLILTSYEFYPAPQDLINWIAKEVFEPTTIQEFGLDEEVPLSQVELFNKAGVSGEQLRNFWIAHWVHPGYRDIVELYRRGQITKEIFWKWFKLVEIPPIWRDGLIHTSWDTPNRIEIRMMCRYLDMPKDKVVKLLEYAGLAEEFRSDAADFMIVMGVESDIRTRYRLGWIDDNQVKSEITSRGVDPTIAKRVFQRIVAEEKPAKVEAERDLTKSEICKGVKLGIISWDEGSELLRDLNYDDWEANFILEVNVGVQMGSPENKTDYKVWTESFKAAAGLPTKMPKNNLVKNKDAGMKAKLPKLTIDPEEVKLQTDTIRRKRRKGILTRDQEFEELQKLPMTLTMINAIVQNDDIRVAEKSGID